MTEPEKRRREAFSSKKPPDVFSVSVGNIAFGGRGKTPTVAYVARTLQAMGERVAILSRGYGRRVVDDGVTVVSDGADILADLDHAGDEPLMLARELPGISVLVCDQRAIAASLAQHVLGATAVVLDDGFQHREMRRDVDLVLVTPADLAGRRVPFGRLRESPSALSRAHAVVVDAVPSPQSPVPSPDRRTADRGLRTADRRRLFRLHRHTHAPAGLPAGARVFVLAGIAGPARVARAAEDAGYVVAGQWAPGDHHRYTRADVARIARDVGACSATAVLTTAKDAERLRPFRPLPFDLHILGHSVTIEADDEGPAFDMWLSERVRSTRERSWHSAPGTQHSTRSTEHPALGTTTGGHG